MGWLFWGLIIACVPDRNAIKGDDQEQQLLGDSARLYWEGVRWGDVDKAANFIQPDRRALFRVREADRQREEKLISAEILQVTLDEQVPTQERQGGRWRTGSALVRTEGYELPAQILHSEEIDQLWYRTEDGWWVDWDSE